MLDVVVCCLFLVLFDGHLVVDVFVKQLFLLLGPAVPEVLDELNQEVPVLLGYLPVLAQSICTNDKLLLCGWQVNTLLIKTLSLLILPFVFDLIQLSLSSLNASLVLLLLAFL